VHHLLEWLRERNFTRIPKLVEANLEEEVLTYLVGSPVFRPWPDVVKTTEWMRELGMWLREYHQAVQGFEVPPGTRFTWGPAQPAPGMVVNHGDLGPWNVIQQHGRVVGVIDWDLARFGEALDDLAQLALEAVPLKPSTWDRLGAEPSYAALQERLRALCEAYGEPDLSKVLRHTADYLEHMALEVQRLGQEGIRPFSEFLKDGWVEDYRTEAQHIRSTFLF